MNRLSVIWIWPNKFYPKFRVQLCADRGAEKWKPYVFLTDLALKYFFLSNEINSAKIKFFAKKYIGGKLFMILNRFENVPRSDLQS